MRNRIIIILSATLSVCVSACVEPFVPEVDSGNAMLVVEGQILCGSNNHQVKLSTSTDYIQDYQRIPVSAAEVYVSDNQNNLYEFHEIRPGIYQNKVQLNAQVGISYALTIITPDGEEYRSDPQRIMPPIEVDELDVKWDVKEFLETSYDGEQTLTQIEGVAVMADIQSETEKAPMMRFETELLTLYCLMDYLADPTYYFCHEMVTTGDKPNVPIPGFNMDGSSSIYHSIGFVTRGVKVLIPDSLRMNHVYKRMLILNQYTLNERSYEYYKQLKQQLDAEGSLFDPMPSQLKGNMHCVTTPTKRVMGFFEASSVVTKTFAFNPEPLRPNNIFIELVSDLSYLPRFDMYRESPPEYWFTQK